MGRDVEMLFRGVGHDYYNRDRIPAITFVVRIDNDSDKVTVTNFLKRLFKQYSFYITEEAINGVDNLPFLKVSIISDFGRPDVIRYSEIYKWTYCENNGDIYEYTYSDIANQKLWMKNVQKFRFIPNKHFRGFIESACIY